MIHNLKVLCLAVVAVFAMSAMVATAAQANSYWFTSDAAAGVNTHLVGEQILRQPGNIPDEWTTTAGVIKCSSIGYTSTPSGFIGPTQSTIIVQPGYTGCTAFGFGAHVIATGCDFVFHAETETAGGIYHATATIDCTPGNEITIIATVGGVTKCTLHIEPQDLGTVTMTKGTKANGIKDIHIDFDLTNAAPNGIKYTETMGTGVGACPTSATQRDGKYTGTMTLTGFNAGGSETNIDLG